MISATPAMQTPLEKAIFAFVPSIMYSVDVGDMASAGVWCFSLPLLRFRSSPQIVVHCPVNSLALML